MVADSRHRGKTYKIEIEKKITESRKKFKIKKNTLESRSILLQESRRNLELNDFEFHEPSS